LLLSGKQKEDGKELSSKGRRERSIDRLDFLLSLVFVLATTILTITIYLASNLEDKHCSQRYNSFDRNIRLGVTDLHIPTFLDREGECRGMVVVEADSLVEGAPPFRALLYPRP
jgi:hypothetical protein